MTGMATVAVPRPVRGAVTHFPSADFVAMSAERVRSMVGYTPEDEPQRWSATSGLDWGQTLHRVRTTDAYKLHVSPGTLALSVTMARPYDKDDGDAWEAEQELALFAEHFGRETVEVEPGPEGSRQCITEWSARSRARMFRTVAELDLSAWVDAPGRFALVTLTLPGDWEMIAPTGADFKKLLRKLRHRYERATGQPWRLVWKLEFQRRGAPHWHALMKPPALVAGKPFTEWLRDNWVDVCAPDDEWCHRCMWGSCSCATPDTERRRMMRAHGPATRTVDYSTDNMTDPQRVATYFRKHSSKTADGKEYQHVVPELWQRPGAGPGRFWGVAGLARAVETVELHPDDYHAARRIMRHLAHARRTGFELQRRLAVLDGQQVSEATRRATLERLGACRGRYLLRGTLATATRYSGAGGWIVTNRATSVALDIARALTGRHSGCRCEDVRGVKRRFKIVRREGHGGAPGVERRYLLASSVCAHCYSAWRAEFTV